MASYLYELGYRNATFVAGSDRLASFQKLLSEYNGVEGKGHGFYKFEVLDFKSSGERDPDSPGVSGISASKARERAVAGDLKGFEEATGSGQYAEELYNAVRKGMGVKESTTEARKANTAGARAEFGKRPRKDTLSDKEKEQKKSDSDAAWERLMAYAAQQKKEKGVAEAPIEMDPTDPMNPMIVGHDKANPAKLKYRMLRAAGQLKDLAARAENASPAEWQTMARQFEELKMNMEQIRHALEELGKMRKKGGVRSRGIDPMVDNVNEFAADDGNGGEENTLRKYAKMWYNGDDATQQQVEKILDRMGWEIGELESEEGGAFVVQSGDENGDSYIGFAPEDLTEGYGRYWCSTDKKWKTRKGPKQSRSSK